MSRIEELIDYEEDEIVEKPKKFKNHQFLDGRLLQTNKKYSQLKESQKNLIAKWFRIECTKFFEQNGKFPSLNIDTEVILDAVYKKIEDRNIWIPFGEIIKYYSKKKTKITNKVLKKFEIA